MSLVDTGIRLERAPRHMSHGRTMELVEMLRSRAPKGTVLDSMTPEDLKKELENRD